MTSIHLGISTCPNDTFAFHGILERKVDLRGLDFRIELRDVEGTSSAFCPCFAWVTGFLAVRW